MRQKFDVIVVGAGLAGSAAALSLARVGLEVLVVERGKFPGSKNMIGGAIFGPALSQLIPDFWEEAPVERYVSRRAFTLMEKESWLTFDFKAAAFDQPPYHGFTVLRAKFDRWLARKVEEAGVIVASGLLATDLLWEGQRVVGVRAGGDELPADVVIAADGVNSLLAQKAGLRGELSPGQVNQGVKEVIQLPREAIEERFNLSGDEGIAWEFLGSCTKGVHGGGFLYSNKESLSLGVVVQLKAHLDHRIKTSDLIEEFKAHPALKGLLRDGKVVEYSAHLVPAAGLGMMPRLYTDGLLVAGDAAALVLATGLFLEGANFALASGMAAAETVKLARGKGDFSKRTLSHYQGLLEGSFVLQDLKTFRQAPAFLENPRLYSTYPELACSLMERLLSVEGRPRKRLWWLAREEMRGKVSLGRLALDALKGARAI